MSGIVVNVHMLGPVRLSADGHHIDDSSDRSRKVWLLLTYLIYNRKRPVPQEELINLLRCQDGANPVGALKTTLHRVRKTLDPLFPGAGHELIVHKNSSYQWSDQYAVDVDADRFEHLCQMAHAEEDDDKRADLYLQALELFEDDFLKKLSAEIWVVPISVYYHKLFLNALLSVLPLLQEQGRWDRIVDLCEQALALEPYQEEFHQFMMLALIQRGQQKKAVSVYEDLCDLLLNEFGTTPSDETRSIYRKALQVIDHYTLQLDTIRRQLEEPATTNGAMICEYDFFRVLYQAKARAIARSGDAVHIALLSMSAKMGDELARRSLDKAMQNLQELIRTNLRKGDIASRCSASQFIIMLPEANYENSCMVCRRVIAAFTRQYPHTPALIDYSVMPLEPFI